MKNKIKEKIIATICILLPASLFFAVHFTIIIQNPFDEMYYSAWQSENNILGKTFEIYTKTSIWSQKGERYGPDFLDPCRSIIYYPSNLQENERVFIIYSRPKEVLFTYDPYTHLAGTFTINLRYHITKKQLVFEPLYYNARDNDASPTLEAYLTQNDISKEDIENLQQRLLYDIVLANWFNANQGVSKYSFEDLGSFKIINNTFEEEQNDPLLPMLPLTNYQ